MRKLSLMLTLVLLLAGCAPAEDFETMSDVYEEPGQIAASNVFVQLPEEAAVPTMETQEGGSLYLCDGFSLALQTFHSGDLHATLKSVTGYDRDRLLVMERRQDMLMRYECAWTAVGEGGDQVARTVVLDDGNYHYTLTLMTDADSAGRLAATWQNILESFCLVSEESGKA